MAITAQQLINNEQMQYQFGSPSTAPTMGLLPLIDIKINFSHLPALESQLSIGQLDLDRSDATQVFPAKKAAQQKADIRESVPVAKSFEPMQKVQQTTCQATGESQSAHFSHSHLDAFASLKIDVPMKEVRVEVDVCESKTESSTPVHSCKEQFSIGANDDNEESDSDSESEADIDALEPEYDQSVTYQHQNKQSTTADARQYQQIKKSDNQESILGKRSKRNGESGCSGRGHATYKRARKSDWLGDDEDEGDELSLLLKGGKVDEDELLFEQLSRQYRANINQFALTRVNATIFMDTKNKCLYI